MPGSLPGDTSESPADVAGLSAVPGPAGVVTMPRFPRVGGGYAAVLMVTGYPAEVAAAWQDPLLGLPGRLGDCLVLPGGWAWFGGDDH